MAPRACRSVARAARARPSSSTAKPRRARAPRGHRGSRIQKPVGRARAVARRSAARRERRGVGVATCGALRRAAAANASAAADDAAASALGEARTDADAEQARADEPGSGGGRLAARRPAANRRGPRRLGLGHRLAPGDQATIPRRRDPRAGTNKQALIYLFGGGFAFVAIILIIVFAFGGSKKIRADDKPRRRRPAAARLRYDDSRTAPASTTARRPAIRPVAPRSRSGGGLRHHGAVDTTGSGRVADTGSAMVATAAKPRTVTTPSRQIRRRRRRCRSIRHTAARYDQAGHGQARPRPVKPKQTRRSPTQSSRTCGEGRGAVAAAQDRQGTPNRQAHPTRRQVDAAGPSHMRRTPCRQTPSIRRRSRRPKRSTPRRRIAKACSRSRAAIRPAPRSRAAHLDREQSRATRRRGAASASCSRRWARRIRRAPRSSATCSSHPRPTMRIRSAIGMERLGS